LPVDVINGLADGLDLLGLVVGDGDFKLLFEFHHQLDDVEGVGAHVFLEGSAARDLLLTDTEVFTDDIDNTFFNARHGFILPKRASPDCAERQRRSPDSSYRDIYQSRCASGKVSSPAQEKPNAKRRPARVNRKSMEGTR